MRTINSLVFVVALAAGSVAAMPAEAQYDRRSSYDNINNERYAHDRGYQSGIAIGRDDARRGWSQDVSRHDVYRRANVGFTVGGLSIQFYQTSFRRGFDDGYRTGYAEIRIGAGRTPGYGYGGAAYPEQVYRGGYGGYGGYGYARQDIAFDRGFNDGYREGLEDARDGDRYDVVGQRNYRRGDKGYNRRYGPRDAYSVVYRDGFRAGYDRGYREAARYSRRGDWRR